MHLLAKERQECCYINNIDIISLMIKRNSENYNFKL